MYTALCCESVCTLSSYKSVSWKIRVHLLVKKIFTRQTSGWWQWRRTGSLGKFVHRQLSTILSLSPFWVHAESALSSSLLKRLRHTSIKLKSAKWVFLRDLHRLNCNGFLFLVSPADIMMWPLLLLCLLLLPFVLFFVFRCCFFCVLVFSAC